MSDRPAPPTADQPAADAAKVTDATASKAAEKDTETEAADSAYGDESTSECSSGDGEGSGADDADETAIPALLATLSPALGAAAQQLTRSTLCRIHRLAQVIRSGAYVVIVTGAGVSVASGIRTYRSGKDGLWNNYVYEWGTKRKFLSDPAGWYTNFWLKAHDPREFLNAQPGPSHIAIAQIMKFAFSPCSLPSLCFALLFSLHLYLVDFLHHCFTFLCRHLPQNVPQRAPHHAERGPPAPQVGRGPQAARRGPRRRRPLPLLQVVCYPPPTHSQLLVAFFNFHTHTPFPHNHNNNNRTCVYARTAT